MRINLTDITIRQLSAPESGQLKVWDTKLPGFGVIIGKRTKTFTVVYGKERKNKSIGRYPAISLSDARREAMGILATQPHKNAVTRLSELVTAFLSDCRERLRPKSVAAYETVLKNAPDIDIKNANRHTVTVTTAHEIKAYKALFNWAVREEITDRNPFLHLSVAFGERDRVLTDDELKAIWSYEWPPYSTYIKLCIITGQRIGQWKNYTLDSDRIIFPASIMKSGKEHSIPLTKQAQSLIEQLRPFNGWSKAKARLDHHVSLPHWRVHDLRRTFSTNLASLSVPIHITERILAHTGGTISGVAAIYNRYTYHDEMREALLTYEAHLSKIVSARA